MLNIFILNILFLTLSKRFKGYMFGIKSFNIKINGLVLGNKNSHLELFSDINTDIV